MVMKPASMSSVVTFLSFLQLLLALAAINISLSNGSTYPGCCIESERQALLRFKKDLKDPSNRLASWVGDGDCCKWAGVVCDNFTGHVLELHLRNPHLIIPETYPSVYKSSLVREAEYEASKRSELVGKINPSLLDFKHLSYLDLSGNFFEGIKIPTYFGSLRNLKYLNLSHAGFEGMIPHQLGNLSNLQHLDLAGNYQLYVENFSWLSGLSLLKHLDLSEANLSKAFDWLPVVNTLPSLVELRLSDCLLDYSPPLPIANLSTLVTLDLSDNPFYTPLICSWIFGLENAVFIDISFNWIEGPIPGGFQNLTSLEHFDLSFNNFNLSIPDWLYRFSHLAFLSLRSNALTGMVSNAITNLTSIERLDLSSYELLQWRIPRSFGSLCNLRSIALSGVKLSQEISEILNILSGCVSDSLELLDLESTQVSGRLTNQLGQFKSLNTLSLSYNSISGFIPPSLGEISSLEYLDLSGNNLNGELSQVHFVNLTRLLVFCISRNSITLKVNRDWVPPFQLEKLGMRSCKLGHQFPLWLHSQKRLTYLDISNTGISDTIPRQFLNYQFQLYYLNLSHNQFHGEIPTLTPQLDIIDFNSNNLSGSLPLVSSPSILDLSNNAFTGSIFNFLCSSKNKSRTMRSLNLRNNSLSGRLPNCWMNWSELLILNLAKNGFTGRLPTSMGVLHSLYSLHLGENSFSGMIPISLKNCTRLQALDIGGNEFVGNVPAWIGETFSGMTILNLHSNRFHGFLPVKLCHLKSLQILDLGHNNLSGTIPRCISNFSAMGTKSDFGDNSIFYIGFSFSGTTMDTMIIEDASLVIKGTAGEYSTILNLVRYIDFSYNNFSEEIPTEVTSLRELQSLNLSHNSFTGRIPQSIGAMRALESLDLSGNKLEGEIPQSITNLTFLSFLNLSNNNLIGKIPSSTQMQTLNASCFIGNQLCGAPLPRNCTATVPTPDDHHGNEDEVDWFYVSMALGFVVGFWSVIGSLLVNRRWRYMYCQFLNRLGDKFFSVVRKCC
ncbi:hypothetical protein ACOSP7_030444 [Xanthoceras sorbifolium]